MADLQLTARYRPTQLKEFFFLTDLLRWTFLVVVPSLGFIVASIFLLYKGLTLTVDDLTIRFAFFGIIYGLLATIAYYATKWGVRDFHIKLSKDGIVLPWLVSVAYWTRSNLMWNEVKEATISSLSGRDRLILQLDTGKMIALDLSGFERDELEQILLGAELWGTNTVRTPELIDYQASLQNAACGVDRPSYTQMWEDELSRRFRSTSFLPLNPKHKLQNGRLQVVRQLAFGGLSAIYLVQRDEQDLFVLKEAVVPSNADPAARREAERHLARESQLLLGLAHDSIARVVDHFAEEGRTYLLMEYINGQDLRQFVRQNGPQPAEKVVDWALEVAEALHYLHHREPPIIHRDLTPENVVLSNKGKLIIIDFGAANEFIGTATGTLIGKQSYIAPEQLRGKAVCQSDLYAFGATLYFLLTGRDPLPLTRSSLRSVLPEASPKLDELIGALTALDTKDRIADTQTLIRKLDEILLGESADA